MTLTALVVLAVSAHAASLGSSVPARMEQSSRELRRLERATPAVAEQLRDVSSRLPLSRLEGNPGSSPRVSRARRAVADHARELSAAAHGLRALRRSMIQRRPDLADSAAHLLAAARSLEAATSRMTGAESYSVVSALRRAGHAGEAEAVADELRACAWQSSAIYAEAREIAARTR